VPFRFPLAVVLHYRQSLEHQQELRLRATNQQVARVRRAIDNLEQRMRDAKLQNTGQLHAGTTAAELRFSLIKESALHQQRQQLLRELVRVENLRDEQQKIFQQARRERETFESLRDSQLREYELEAMRREQRQLDDLFLLRRAYLRRG
jgi:flagellar export protein FliJ